ncbi:MAG: hypothetical protein QM635_07550 [Microbacteriaceae bacterium]
MKLFRRKRRNLGRYEPPPPREPPPLERVVEDGVLIAFSSVRMTLRNRIIVDALRERADLDREALAALAGELVEQLAEQEWEAAERLRLRYELRARELYLDDDEAEAMREDRRRDTVHRALSEALAARADDPVELAALVERSREEAWVEIAAFLQKRAEAQVEGVVAVPDPGYAAEREDRIAVFLALDLAALADERGGALEP